MGTPAGGKEFPVVQIGIARVVEGKVTEPWNIPDQLGLLQQIGAVPATISGKAKAVTATRSERIKSLSGKRN